MGWSEEVQKRGYWQKGLYDILVDVSTSWTGVLAKLDADGGVADTNYESLYSVTTPTIGATFGKTIQPNGMKLGDVVLLCKRLRANFNSVMDKLAADGTVNGTTVFTNLKFSATADLIDQSNARVKILGEHQDALIGFLDTFINVFNDALDLLDADSGVSGTNYFSLWGITDVVEVSSSSSSSVSSSSSSRSSSSSSSSSSSCRSSSSSSSSSSSCRSSSSSSSSSSSRSSSSSSSSSSCRSSSSSSRSSSSSSSSSRSSSSSSSCSSSSSSCSSSSSSSRSSSSSSSSSQAVN